MYRALIICLGLGLVLGLGACKQPKVEPLTLTEFNEYCMNDATLDCQGACGAVSSVLNANYPSASACRDACDKAGQDYQMNMLTGQAENCADSMFMAVRLCSQYCDGHFPK